MTLADKLNNLFPSYVAGEVVGWTCSRCGWTTKRDFNLSNIDALAIARAEFLSHSCAQTLNYAADREN
jgi:hypothetical protein